MTEWVRRLGVASRAKSRWLVTMWEVDDFGTLMIECQGRVNRDADVDKLRDLVDGEGGGVILTKFFGDWAKN